MPSLFSKSGGGSNSIDDLKSMISKKGGMANPTLFKVFLPSLQDVGAGASTRELNLLCTGAVLPGRQIMTQDRDIGGVVQKVANNSATADISLNFRVMNDYGVKEYFEAWQNSAISQGTMNGNEVIQLQYSDKYQYNVKIQQLKKGFGIPIYRTALPLPRLPTEIMNRLPKVDILGGALGNIDFAQGELELGFKTQDQVVYECTLVDAFCTTMNEISFSDASTNAIIEFNVQLSYRRWFRTDDGVRPMDALESTISTMRNIAGL